LENSGNAFYRFFKATLVDKSSFCGKAFKIAQDTFLVSVLFLVLLLGLAKAITRTRPVKISTRSVKMRTNKIKGATLLRSRAVNECMIKLEGKAGTIIF